ncbi:MAG: NADH-quinone oxidoreductase subunit C [Armatimonadetes bacterium]|nr:NADH-quinone oxidoreductase subunit C [Armatimonadota bacterium]
MGQVTNGGQAVEAALTEAFGDLLSFVPTSDGMLTVELAEPSRLLDVLGWLRSHADFAFAHLADVTAVDRLPREPRFDLVYHLFSLALPLRLRLRVPLALDQPIASVTGLWSGANYSEREVFDLFGIVFSGHPNLERILLPDDYVGFPLRRDHPLGEIPVDFDLPYRKRFGHA